MAEENGEATAGADAPEADDVIEFIDWTCQLTSVERVEADEINDPFEVVFIVNFAVDGPDANAEVEISVSDCEDDAHVVGIGLDTLHRAMKAWGRITESRRIAARASDLPD